MLVVGSVFQNPSAKAKHYKPPPGWSECKKLKLKPGPILLKTDGHGGFLCKKPKK